MIAAKKAIFYRRPIRSGFSSLPEITALSREVGSTYHCYAGKVSGTPIYTYQWKRDGVNIGGATSNTYTTVPADYNTSITCTVTANGGVKANSNAITCAWSPLVYSTSGCYITGHIDNCYIVPNAVSGTGVATQTVYNKASTSGFNFTGETSGTILPTSVKLGDNNYYVRLNARLKASLNAAQGILQGSFTCGFEIWPDDGIPAATQMIVHDVANTAAVTNSRFQIYLNNTGRILCDYSVGGTTVSTSSTNPIFSDGTQSAPTAILLTFTSGGSVVMYVNGVSVSVTGGNLSTVTMANYANTTNELLIGQQRTGVSAYALTFVGAIRNFVLQSGVYTSGDITNHAALTTSVYSPTRKFGALDIDIDNSIYGSIESSNRMALISGYSPNCIIDGTDTLFSYFDRMIPPYDGAGQLLKIASNGTLTGPTEVYAASGISDQHLNPVILKESASTYYAIASYVHNGLIRQYKSTTGFNGSYTMDLEFGTTNAYPSLFRDATRLAILTRVGSFNVSVLTTTDFSSYTQRVITTPDAGFISYPTKPINGSVGGWHYFCIDWVKSTSPTNYQRKFLLKTQDWVTFYNFGESFSKDIVASGQITPTELKDNYQFYATATDAEAGAFNCTQIDNSGNFYAVCLAGDGNLNNNIFIKNEGAGFVQQAFTIPNVAAHFFANRVVFDHLMKTQNYFYAFGRIDINGVVRLKVFRANHTFTQIEDLGLLNERITDFGNYALPYNVYGQSSGQVFQLISAQEPENPADSGEGRGFIFYQKSTLKESLI